MAPLVSWIPKLNSKVFFTSKDQFDAMITAVTKDKMLKPNHKGFRRAVRILFIPPIPLVILYLIFRHTSNLAFRYTEFSSPTSPRP
jgi:hypothetical protein